MSADIQYDEFKKSVLSCKTEEDLKFIFSTKILSSLKLPFEQIKQEVTVLEGRLDSLYGSVVLEFKAPGDIPEHKTQKKFKKIQDQVSRHIKGISDKKKINKKNIVGIIFDGIKVAYQYELENDVIVEGPYNLENTNFSDLLDKLVSGLTEPKAFKSDNLIEDFGYNSKNYINTIETIYDLIKSHKTKKASILFDQWKIYFQEICGYDFKSKKNLTNFSNNFFGIKNPEIDLLAFSIHTYYSILLNFIALKLGSSFSKDLDVNFYFNKFSSSENKELLDIYENIFDGKPFKDVGFPNLIEATFFHWFIYENSKQLNDQVKNISNLINTYSTKTLSASELFNDDILRDLYQSISPKELRHALGEYYTADWLAEYVIKKSGYCGDKNSKVLDPACGSGTFISKLISTFKKENLNLKSEEIVKKILENISGIDLNPLAVTSSKINYLVSIGEKHLNNVNYENIEIPIYLSDSMLAPLEHKYEKEDHYVIPTKVGNFKLNKEFVENKKFTQIMTKLHDAIINKQSYVDTKNLIYSELEYPEKDIDKHIKELFNQLTELEKKGINGVWSNIIKNFFSPIFINNVDFIIGNPPWVNWQNLPESYRDSIKKYWSHYAYNLFRHKGLDARLGSAHDDICVLLTYIVSDIFLKKNGVIAFLLPLNLFKSKGGGEGFRSFKIKDSFDLGVISVDDFVEINPFDASTKPSLFLAKKGLKNSYPVEYLKWKKPENWKSKEKHVLDSVINNCKAIKQTAVPIDQNDITSPWLTGSKQEINFFKKLVGESYYRARKGVDSSLNGVFWVKENKKKGNITEVINCVATSKTPLRQKTFWIEDKSLYPLLRGKNFSKWKYKLEYKQILLYDQNSGRPLSKDKVTRNFPRAWRYFEDSDYKSKLFKRGIYNKHLKSLNYPQYACFDIGPYTFSKYKVVWKAIAGNMQSVVIGNDKNKIIIPDHNVLMIPLNNLDEAHYICAILNSKICTNFINSFVEWFFSSHILKYFKIPKFDKSKSVHKKLSLMSKEAHKNNDNHKITAELDDIVPKLFG